MELSDFLILLRGEKMSMTTFSTIASAAGELTKDQFNKGYALATGNVDAFLKPKETLSTEKHAA